MDRHSKYAFHVLHPPMKLSLPGNMKSSKSYGYFSPGFILTDAS